MTEIATDQLSKEAAALIAGDPQFRLAVNTLAEKYIANSGSNSQLNLAELNLPHQSDKLKLTDKQRQELDLISTSIDNNELRNISGILKKSLESILSTVDEQWGSNWRKSMMTEVVGPRAMRGSHFAATARIDDSGDFATLIVASISIIDDQEIWRKFINCIREKVE
jgi:hypothetical protein